MAPKTVFYGDSGLLRGQRLERPTKGHDPVGKKRRDKRCGDAQPERSEILLRIGKAAVIDQAESGRGQEFPSFVADVESALLYTAATVINRLRLACNMIKQPPEVTDQFAPRGGV